MEIELTIEPGPGGYDVVEHSVYDDSSVLAGQPRRRVLDSGINADALAIIYPSAEILEHRTRIDLVMPDCPPSDFDPSDAGEAW